MVTEGQVIADGPATANGEISGLKADDIKVKSLIGSIFTYIKALKSIQFFIPIRPELQNQ